MIEIGNNKVVLTDDDFKAFKTFFTHEFVEKPADVAYEDATKPVIRMYTSRLLQIESLPMPKEDAISLYHMTWKWKYLLDKK